MHYKVGMALSYRSAEFEPTDWLRFVHLDPFSRKWTKLGLTDDDLRALEIMIMLAGESNPVIKQSGGLRKIRFAPPESNRGKRGAFRVCYCLFPDHGIALLATVFGKNEKDDLGPDDLKAVAQVIRYIQHELEQGNIR